MASTNTFSGFPRQTVTFLRGLAAHNEREWFAAHRADYETAVMEPARAFVTAMGGRLKRLTPGIRFDPRANGSLFRIFRDTRFSPDKSPYKTNLGILFWEGRGPRMGCSGYYVHLEPPVLMLGAGLYIIPRPLLERYRRAVADPEYGTELAAIVRKLSARPGYTLGGEHYKRVPAGYDADPAAAGLLRHAGLYAGWEGPIPPELHSAALVEFCWEKFKPMEPLHRWLATLVAGGFEL
jgi:uncharacterized protein (TIGR02453 family)